MLSFAREVLTFTQGRSRADYDTDAVLRPAVERATELIGEAASNISDSMRAAHPEIPWRKVVGQRNVLIHDYGDVDDDLVWNLVELEVPRLVSILEGIVANDAIE
ncbi:MAG TPA: HepT-like ribonuclease domain-containing protein [Thermoanaerobaculia bacterium]|jgi:uncharacterized protein with HEPN domain|nr:HepT-like ribonuclease domain-containing protein [Thermoanaerobaculia bacterium]